MTFRWFVDQLFANLAKTDSNSSPKGSFISHILLAQPQVKNLLKHFKPSDFT